MFGNKGESIEQLLKRLRSRFGAQALRPYGDYTDPKSVGFRIHRIDATFSVIAENQLEADGHWHDVDGQQCDATFDIQIESYPPGDYLYSDENVSLDRFMELAELVTGPKDNWPQYSL